MPSNAETTIRSRMLKRAALLALAVMACAGLAGCGGGSGTGAGSAPVGGEEVMITPDPSGGSPDLVVESLSVSNANPVAGADITLLARVRNDGDGRAAAVRVRFYRSDDAAITPSDTQVGADAVGELAPSESRVASVESAAPSAPGTYYYGACAAAGESDTANNCSASVRVTVPELQDPPAQETFPEPARPVPSADSKRPDLVMDRPSMIGANPFPDVHFVLSLNMRNAGDGNAKVVATWVRIYRSDDATITRSDTQVSGLVPAWVPAPSKSTPFKVRLTSPPTAGTYYYGACADAVSDESDTANNCSPSAQVTVREGTPPDLVAESPSVSDANPFTGASFKITAPVRNAGGRRSESSTLRFYRSDDATITRSDTQVEATGMSPVQPSKSWTSSRFVRAPSTPGTYYYGACVDEVAGESEAENNCSPAVEITARESPPPNLVLGSPRVFPASPAAGGVFALVVKLRNAGGGHVESTTLRFYRSDDATITKSDTPLGSHPITNVQPWESREVIYSPLATPDPGTYYYGACVDAVAEESDTTDNCSSPVKVEVTHAKLNLQFHSWNMSRDPDGNPVQMDATLRNVGAPAAATTLRFYQSPDEEFTSSDIEIASVSVPALLRTKPREFPRFLSRLVSVSAPSAPGTYYYGACVDAVSGESDTTDNCRTIHTIVR